MAKTLTPAAPTLHLCLEARLEVVEACRRAGLSDAKIQTALRVTARSLANYKRRLRERERRRVAVIRMVEA